MLQDKLQGEQLSSAGPAAQNVPEPQEEASGRAGPAEQSSPELTSDTASVAADAAAEAGRSDPQASLLPQEASTPQPSALTEQLPGREPDSSAQEGAPEPTQPAGVQYSAQQVQLDEQAAQQAEREAASAGDAVPQKEEQLVLSPVEPAEQAAAVASDTGSLQQQPGAGQERQQLQLEPPGTVVDEVPVQEAAHLGQLEERPPQATQPRSSGSPADVEKPGEGGVEGSQSPAQAAPGEGALPGFTQGVYEEGAVVLALRRQVGTAEHRGAWRCAPLLMACEPDPISACCSWQTGCSR